MNECINNGCGAKKCGDRVWNRLKLYLPTYGIYYGFQTVCKCPFWALLVTLVTDANQTWAN